MIKRAEPSSNAKGLPSTWVLEEISFFVDVDTHAPITKGGRVA
jgi:hypothetical protein